MAGILDFLGLGKDVKDAADGVLGGVTKIIDSAKGQLPPEQQVQIEQIRTDIQAKMATIEQASAGQLQQFMLAYEGGAKDIPHWLLVWRDVIRPAVTSVTFLSLFILIGDAIVERLAWKSPMDQILIANMPDAYWWILGAVTVFWFGGKAIERGAQAIGKAKG